MARIIDLAGLAGAYATRLFAEQGHEVIRLESPGGDSLRRLPPFLGDKQDLEHGAYHQFLNAGKKSLALNLGSPAGQKILLELLNQSDVLVADRALPFKDQFVFEANPKLVITKIQDQEPELCAVARSGLMSLIGQPGQAPAILGAHVPSLAVGIYVAVATAAALLTLTRTGTGSIATVSVREALESFVEQAMVEYSFSGTVTERRGSKGAITAVSGALPCKNGHWVISQIHRPGGSVAMLATQNGLNTGPLVLLSCPVHSIYMPDFSRTGPVVSIRVKLDLVILADGGGQKFSDPRIREKILPIWFDHSATHNPAVWQKYNLPSVIPP